MIPACRRTIDCKKRKFLVLSWFYFEQKTSFFVSSGKLNDAIRAFLLKKW